MRKFKYRFYPLHQPIHFVKNKCQIFQHGPREKRYGTNVQKIVKQTQVPKGEQINN